MNRELLQLQRNLIDGPPKSHPKYDHYTYNALSWTAQHLSYQAKTEEERQLCLLLKAIAIKKSETLEREEQVSA